MYVERTTSKTATKTHECFLLRESYREDGKVLKRTIANISHLPRAEIEALKVALRCKQPVVSPAEMSMKTGKIVGSLTVVREIAKKLGIESALGSSRKAALCLWLIFARLVEQGSRLSAARLAERHDSSLLGLDSFDENDLYDALTWVSEEQEAIQQALFKRRYGNKSPRLFLYDVTSSYLEGVDNQLAWWGYNRDGKKGKKQVVFGLLTDDAGEPIAVEVFRGNTADPTTFVELVTGFSKRFGVSEVIFVGDRGMIKKLGIEELHKEKFKYITGITTAQIKALMKEDIIQLSLFDSELHEAQDGDLRYIFRRNPIRATEVSTARIEKLARLQELAKKETLYLTQHSMATEEKAVQRVQGQAEKLKLGSLVEVKAEARTIQVIINEIQWQEAAQLDGCYVLKTDVSATELDTASVHARYKDLAKVERGFRTIKTGLLEVRPIWLRDEAKTKGHIFICMLAYMVSRELKSLAKGEETVQDLIAELNTVTELTITAGKEKIKSIPQPREIAARIATHLGINYEPAKAIPTKRRSSKSA